MLSQCVCAAYSVECVYLHVYVYVYCCLSVCVCAEVPSIDIIVVCFFILSACTADGIVVSFFGLSPHGSSTTHLKAFLPYDEHMCAVCVSVVRIQGRVFVRFVVGVCLN